ncbi:MAG: hypothetical protein ACOCZ7_04120, partial [Armatimonadota bacterium]
MGVQIGIIVVLIVAGVLIWRLAAKALNEAMDGVDEPAEVEDEAVSVAPREPEGPVGPDGLMVLFAD